MIISASRRTDIPAFYSDWFFTRLKEGFVYVRNPFNRKQISKISLLKEDVDCFVFWTKNPKPFVHRLMELTGYPFYVHYTINSYDNDIEPFVLNKNEVIETFIELSKAIGKEKVIWRYDPILLSEKYTIEYHLQRFESLAKLISPYTETCVISFIDRYKKNERDFKNSKISCLNTEEILSLSKSLKDITDTYTISLKTCAESIELESIGIEHNQCIDATLIEKMIGSSIKKVKDKNQRISCECIESVDIGAYNTCKHGCLYCYATDHSPSITGSTTQHSSTSPLLSGTVQNNEIITESKRKSIVLKKHEKHT